MYNVVFYEDETGYSQIEKFLRDLLEKSSTNKDARIQHKQIMLYIHFYSSSLF